jgi:hypothetical protein
MSKQQGDPTCPKCGAAMIRRTRGSDGSRFWGCSTFPTCRGTRELVAPASRGTQPAPPVGAPIGLNRGHGIHFDRLVLACGAVGLVIGVGLIVVGLNSRPSGYALIGAVLLCLMALVVLLSPFLPPAFARSYGLRVAFLCVFLAVFLVALDPVSKWLGQYFTDLFTHSIPTHAPATPSIALPGGA